MPFWCQLLNGVRYIELAQNRGLYLGTFSGSEKLPETLDICGHCFHFGSFVDDDRPLLTTILTRREDSFSASGLHQKPEASLFLQDECTLAARPSGRNIHLADGKPLFSRASLRLRPGRLASSFSIVLRRDGAAMSWMLLSSMKYACSQSGIKTAGGSFAQTTLCPLWK
jgi:hypothetical protein